MTGTRTGLRWITQDCSFEEGCVPNLLGPYLPIAEGEVESFNGFLSDEIDSSYTSNICCCDFCYEDFRARWPDVPFRNSKFQTQSADSMWLVDCSRIPGVYSPAEISSLRRLVQCPKCQGVGPANVYIFEHRFSDAEELEVEISELSSLGARTPFLMLENDLAQRVRAEIRRAAGSSKMIDMGTRFFRARLEADVLKAGQPLNELRTFGPAPARFVAEGRFNHAGNPVTYVADLPDLAAAEIGRPKERCIVGELEIARPLSYLDLFEIDEDEPGFELMSALACSALLASPNMGEGWVKQQYIFSRFVADCAYSAGFDAIRYGSTKLQQGSNYVILTARDDVKQILRLIGNTTVVCSEPAKRY